MNPNQQIVEETISHNLDLMRLDAGIRQQVLEILQRMRSDLIAKLANENLTDIGKQRTNALLKECSATIYKYMTMAQGELDGSLQGLGKVTASHTADTITAAVSLEAHLPTAEVFRAMVTNVLVQGSTIAGWWDRQSMDLQFKFSNAVRQGIANGETNGQIIGRITGRTFPGIIEIAQRNAAALVQTSVQAVANEARLETYSENQDIIHELEWRTTLDGHVCELCAARDGLSWHNDESRTPIGHSIPFENPPIHFNDRCFLAGVTSITRELRKTGERAATGGPVKADTSFDDWLSKRTPAQQDAQLGKGRAELYRNGTISLRDLIDGRGRELTLAELKSKYA